MKELLKIVQATPSQVGDGFFIRRAMPNGGIELGELNPLLLLDHAGPTKFQPSMGAAKGVDAHPHRGFETVTIVYSGELQHRDSEGGFGKIGTGDIQWMTAGKGVVHEEKHSEAFTRDGGTLEMIQLWINLPAAHKMTSAKYQDITADRIPVIEQSDGSRLRIIAGKYLDQQGAATTFSPLQLLDADFQPGAQRLNVPEGHHAAVYTLKGEWKTQQQRVVEGEMAVFTERGDTILLDVNERCRLLVMTAEPLREPISSYGPFVMNTARQIQEALSDFHTGKMGSLE